MIYGEAGANRSTVNLDNLSGSAGFVILGDGADDGLGISVSGAGDINGDGYADIIVGANRADDGGQDAGEAYVIFGTGQGFGQTVGGVQTLDLSELNATTGFAIRGDFAGDGLGTSVSGAGDINGDGYDDLIVGALKCR